MTSTLTQDGMAKAIATSLDLTGKMADLYRKIGELAQQRGEAHAALLATPQVRAMIARGQKTMRVDGGVIEAGTVKNRICGCHGAPLDECTTVGEVVVVERETGEVWIKVRSVFAARDEEVA